MTPRNADKTYIYGVIPTGQAVSFGPLGVGGRGDEVHAVAYRDIAAVVSRCPARDYAAMSKEALVRELAQHQQVVEQAMQRFPVLPVKFGTTVDGEAKVETILRRGYARFKTALADIQDKAQVEVVARWDLESVLGEVAREAPIAELKEQIGNDSSSSSIPDRVRLGELIKRSLDLRRGHYEREVLKALAPCAADVRRNPLFDDSFVLNLAVLVGKERQEELDRALEKLDKKLDGRLNVRRVGPLPPYSFCTVEVKPLSHEEVEGARQLLGLSEQASSAEIKEAYYREARAHHPDAQAGGGRDGDEDGRFADVRTSFELLTQYCQAQLAGEDVPVTAPKDQRCSFEPSAVEETVLITIQPSGGAAA